MSAVTTATFRSLNDSKTPMFVTMGAVGLNTVLGLFLVFGWGPFPKLGVIGAGLATLIAQVSRFLTLLVCLYRKEKGLEVALAAARNRHRQGFSPPSGNYLSDRHQ
jgi:Na+-driven multidrug efflux pump